MHSLRMQITFRPKYGILTLTHFIVHIVILGAFIVLARRFEVLSVDLTTIEGLSAVQTAEGKPVIIFREDDINLIRTVRKRNTQLFDCLSVIKQQESNTFRYRAAEGVLRDFRHDLAMVSFAVPPEMDNIAVYDRQGNGVALYPAQDIVTVLMEDGFRIGSTRYVPLVASAAMSRTNNYLYVNQVYADRLMRAITLDMIAMDEDGNYCAQCEGIINQGRSYLNNTDGKSRASTYVSVAAPDVDDDGILMEHIGTKAYYSKPEVQAVLQSAPYFQDVADVYDNYLNNGATAYGTSKATGEGGTASVSASLGIFVSSESSALACHEMEMDVSVTTSYDHATIKDVETSMDYAGDAGDDYVVMYTIPYYRYYYDATFPDGSTDIITIEEPMTPATVIVPVETYDELAATTQGLEPIRGNILTNIPGDPASYSSWPKGTPTPIGEVQMLTNAGPNSGSTVTVSRTVSTTKEHSFSIGIEENLEVGFGGGVLGNDTVVGIQQGFAIAGGGTYSKMDGVAYTGTVDNLPYGVEGYAFNWQLGITETTLKSAEEMLRG